MPVQAKICGLSTPETLDAAIAGGASHVGFVFFPKSPRNITPAQAAQLAARAAGRARTVGLFVDPEPGLIASVLQEVALDVIQLHGAEPPAFAARIAAETGKEVWKAIPVKTASDLSIAGAYTGAVQQILYDAKPPEGADRPGGTGLRIDWKLLEGVAHPLPWILAGGLDPDNIAEAASISGARMVDVSSGVESSPGIKDVDKIAAFLKAAHSL